MVDRTRREFSEEDIAKVADTYHAWREGEGYEDVPGFAMAAGPDAIAGHGYVLTPGRYVGAEDEADGGAPFPERFAALRATLDAQFAESEQLTGVIRERLGGVVVDE